MLLPKHSVSFEGIDYSSDGTCVRLGAFFTSRFTYEELRLSDDMD